MRWGGYLEDEWDYAFINKYVQAGEQFQLYSAEQFSILSKYHLGGGLIPSDHLPLAIKVRV